MSISYSYFCSALSQLASGVSIITTCTDGDRRGITATAVCSVSAEPPTILVCANSATGTAKMIADAGCFAVNLLEASQQDVSNTFAGQGGVSGAQRFETGLWLRGNKYGLPLLNGALAQLECKVDQIVKAGTHHVYFGLVKNASINPGTPLLFHTGKYLSVVPDDTEVDLSSWEGDFTSVSVIKPRKEAG